jgi:hypothetical protein
VSVLASSLSHPHLLWPLLLHGAQVPMADAEAVPEDFFLAFDAVQFKKDWQLKPYKFLRSECTRRCCVMPGGTTTCA